MPSMLSARKQLSLFFVTAVLAGGWYGMHAYLLHRATLLASEEHATPPSAAPVPAPRYMPDPEHDPMLREWQAQPVSPPPRSPPGAGISTEIRMDPKHPLKIGPLYYPEASRRAHEEGQCIVEIHVATDGRIIDPHLRASSGFERLDQACLDAVRNQRMIPATKDGKPIDKTIAIPINWKLPPR